jgi:hypothetical protein
MKKNSLILDKSRKLKLHLVKSNFILFKKWIHLTHIQGLIFVVETIFLVTPIVLMHAWRISLHKGPGITALNLLGPIFLEGDPFHCDAKYDIKLIYPKLI